MREKMRERKKEGGAGGGRSRSAPLPLRPGSATAPRLSQPWWRGDRGGSLWCLPPRRRSSTRSRGTAATRGAPPPPEPVRLKAGVLCFPARTSGGGGEFRELTSFVALTAPALRRLAVVTGTPVLVKNTDNNVGRIVKAVLLEQPSLDEVQRDQIEHVASTSPSDRVMGFLPCCSFPATGFASLDEDVAFVSPLLAFNLGVHVSCRKLLIQKGGEPFKFCSRVKEHDTAASAGNDLFLHLELLPCPQVPKYALHLRVSVVRIPECGVLASLKINSGMEEVITKI